MQRGFRSIDYRMGHPAWPTVGRGSLWAMLLILLVAAAGCTGNRTYPIDIFQEMHYQASKQSQEPPRRMPPPDSVPTSGKEVQLSAEQLLTVANPVARTQSNLDRGETLYQTNCSMCHGKSGKGEGPVALKFKAANATTLPTNLSLPTTQDKAAGQIWGIITNGGLNMPAFRNLLTPEERWLLVLYLKEKLR